MPLCKRLFSRPVCGLRLINSKSACFIFIFIAIAQALKRFREMQAENSNWVTKGHGSGYCHEAI